jgi:hypothetical protein
MKTTVIISICLAIAILVIPSCEKEPVRREPAKIELNKKAAEIIEADRAFGFELFREVLGLSDAENIMISPMSVSYALGMTYNGAAGTTLEAFEEVLHFAGDDGRGDQRELQGPDGPAAEPGQQGAVLPGQQHLVPPWVSKYSMNSSTLTGTISMPR